MEYENFRTFSDEQMREFAISRPVNKWPVGFVRELTHRDYHPLADQPELVEQSQGLVSKAFESVNTRLSEFGKILRFEMPNFPKLPELLLNPDYSIQDLPLSPEIDSLQLDSPRVEEQIFKDQILELVRRISKNTEPSNWLRTSSIAAVIAAAAAVFGVLYQLLKS